jgi:hypothetical protein
LFRCFYVIGSLLGPLLEGRGDEASFTVGAGAASVLGCALGYFQISWWIAPIIGFSSGQL